MPIGVKSINITTLSPPYLIQSLTLTNLPHISNIHPNKLFYSWGLVMGLKVFAITADDMDCNDWVIASNAKEAIKYYIDEIYGELGNNEAYDEYKNTKEIPEDELNTLTFFDENTETTRTFKEELDSAINEYKKTPYIFSSVEY